MKTRNSGNSGLRLSILGVGCWAFGGGEYWGAQDQRDVNDVVHCAVDRGITYFDTAEVYNDGRSETSLGLALQELPRDRVIIGTKISPHHCTTAALVESCEASLTRLGTDYIDLYMIHWPINSLSVGHFTDDRQTIEHPPGYDEAQAGMEKLQREGKVRHVGVSNFARSALERITGNNLTVAVNQLPYSLLARAIEWDVLPYCRESGVGVIGYMTLAQGLLARTYAGFAEIPEWRRRTRHFSHRRSPLSRHGEEGAEAETGEALVRIRCIAEKSGLTMSDVAISWALKRSGITCALVGSRNVRQLEANIRGAEQALSDSIIEELNAATRPLMEKLGPGFDYYESRDRDRTLT